jgi:hypothetical protein
MAEWLKAADCKSAHVVYVGSNPTPPIVFFAQIAQLVEHFLGKEEVTGSNPVLGLCPFF